MRFQSGLCLVVLATSAASAQASAQEDVSGPASLTTRTGNGARSTFNSVAGKTQTAELSAQLAGPPDRRHRASQVLHDGILLLHANSTFLENADGFHQDPFFYYFTGLENTVGAVLALDGRTGETWLFLPTRRPFARDAPAPDVVASPDDARRLGLDHIVDWGQLEPLLRERAGAGVTIYYAAYRGPMFVAPELPDSLLPQPSARGAPTWLQVIVSRLPSLHARDATDTLQALMEVQDSAEQHALRSAARATVTAIQSGIRAIHPGVSQRSVEVVVGDACWRAGANGQAFWAWAMSGANGVFPRPFSSLVQYDHLDQTMKSGDLVRLDVGCEWNHYMGDLGRTVPVSGRYTPDQRELWDIFVDAYRTSARTIHAGATVDDVFHAWRDALMSHRSAAHSSLAQRAIDSWSDRHNVPYWEVHTTNLMAGYPAGPLEEGTTINFEPIASIDGQGYFLEDMYIVRKDGAELLTPGVPYSAAEIEAAMR